MIFLSITCPLAWCDQGFNLWSANNFNLDWPKILSFGKELNQQGCVKAGFNVSPNSIDPCQPTQPLQTDSGNFSAFCTSMAILPHQSVDRCQIQ